MRPTTQVTGKENDMIKARIDGVELKISEREPLLAGTVGLNKISLSFSDEWAIFTKQIDFTNEQSGETRRISAEVGVCTVPWELLKAEGDITCYVRGIGSDGRLVLRTNEANLGTVLGSTDGNVPGTGTPTPDVCDETAAKIGDLSKLETNDKSQLVAAINELKRADGLGVFEVTLTAQDGVLTADKTFEQVKAAVADGKPVLKVHSDGDVLWFFLLDKSSAEIDFVGFADEQILAYLTAKQDGSWETTVTARVTVEMLSELSDKLGNLGNLTTTAKNNLVAAINELKSGTAVTEATVSGWGFTKNTGTYSKPTGGIPKTDLASAVQTSLGKADSALQTVPSTYRTASAQDSIDSGKVDKVTGKGLSTNDYTAAAKAKVDAIPASPKYTDTVYDDTAVKNRLTAVENKVAGIGAGPSFSGSYNDLTDKPTIPDAVTEATVSGWGFTKNTGTYSKPTGGIPKTDLASAVQTSLGKADSALQTVPSTYRTASAQDSIDSGKVDKVTGKGLSTNDYTAAAKAKVDAIPASPKYTDTVYDDTAVKNRLTAVEGMETVALTVASGRLTNASYTARYSSLLGMVFVRIYGTVNADMNTGYDYDIMNIGARLPNSHAALAVKSSKAAQAFAKSSGVISLRPLESGIKNYDVYITGFWFA